MNTRRKITVQVSVWFTGMMMESTDDALAIVKGVMVTTSQECKDEIKRALEDAGAQDVTIGMTAY